MNNKYHSVNVPMYNFALITVSNPEGGVVDISTYGLNKYNGYDLQIIPVLGYRESMNLLSTIAKNIIDEGKPVTDNSVLHYLSVKNDEAIVKLIKRTSDSRVLLRVIIQDEHGRYPWDEGCDPKYTKQFTDSDARNNGFIVNRAKKVPV